MMNSDGTGLKVFVDEGTGIKNAFSPAWSPDGKRIAFVNQSGLYITPADNPYAWIKILDAPLVTSQPAWSPDNRQIAVVVDETFRQQSGKLSREIMRGGIVIVNVDGTGVRRLTAGGKPSWSPDGKTIAYRDGSGYWLIDADDTTGFSNRLIFPTSSWIKLGVSVPPRWSPDGKYITVGRKLWIYTDGIYAIPVDNPQKRIWINADVATIWGMSWVK